MKRVLLSVAVAALTLVGLALPLAQVNSDAGSGVDPVTISDYRADYRITAHGDLTARETITTMFPSPRHGIFRFWDITDPSDPHVRYEPKDIDVTLDGGSVPVDLSWESNDRYRVAKIGDPDNYVSLGKHVYVISYTVDGTLAPGSSEDVGGGSWTGANTSRFLWRVIPDGWRMPIAKSESRVELPQAPLAAACRVGNGSSCTVAAATPTTRVITTGALPPMTGVTFRADLPSAAPDRDTTPWPQSFDPVLGRSLIGVIVLVIIAVIILGLGIAWVLRSRESTPLLPVMYEPPLDPQRTGHHLGPVQTYYVTREAMPKRALVASLLYLADRRLVRLDRSGDEWTITALVQSDGWNDVDPVSRAVAESLGLTNGIDSAFAADGSVSAGSALQHASSQLSSAASTWATTSGAIKRSRFEKIGRLLVFLAFAGAAVLFATQLLPYSLLVLPIAAFAIGGAGMWTAGVGTRRTMLGRDIWSRAGGFERLLSTSSNQERLDFSARRELYTDYIPYAVAFDCADEWAQKYRLTTGTEPPMPVWFVPVGGNGGSYGFSGSSGIDSFESSLSSSLSAYSSSQSSSSSSGGGGFSGGGGGGGGGGSW